PEDAVVQRRMVEIARESWLLADSSKLEAVGLARVGPLHDLSGVITDAGAPRRGRPGGGARRGSGRSRLNPGSVAGERLPQRRGDLVDHVPAAIDQRL